MPLSLMHARGFTTVKFSLEPNTLNSSCEPEATHCDLPSTYATSSSATFLPASSIDLPPLCATEVELMSVSELAEMLNLAGWPSFPNSVLFKLPQASEKTDVSTERKRKVIEREQLLPKSNFSKISRSGEQTDISIERKRCVTLTGMDATQAESLCSKSATAQAEKSGQAMQFDEETVAFLLQDLEHRAPLNALFMRAVKQGYKGANLENYLLDVLGQCNTVYKTGKFTGAIDKEKLFTVINKDRKIFSFELTSPLSGPKTNVEGNKVWVQLDKQNCVIDMRRPSVRVDHRISLMNKMLTSNNEEALREFRGKTKIKEMA